MLQYNRTCVGYSHTKEGKVCQDYSEIYSDDTFKIITACDGHGGDEYIRSDRGSKFASEAVIKAIKCFSQDDIKQMYENGNYMRLKLRIICEWNEFVKNDFSLSEMTEEREIDGSEEENFESCFEDESETSDVDLEELKNKKEEPIVDKFDEINEDETTKESFEDEKILHDEFETNDDVNYKLYGTTLNSSILTDDYLICVALGDGGVFGLKDNEIVNIFEENNENVANQTNSMCNTDAFYHMYVKIFKRDEFHGVFLATDGITGNYNTYEDLYNFIRIVFNNFKVCTQKSFDDLNKVIDRIGSLKGHGDDVSVALMLY